jgi:hypothetical protein
MGQYWCIYNETKKEMMNPWGFGEVAKLHEWPQDGPGGMQSALVVLLLEKSSLGDGGGDFDFSEAPQALQDRIGSWRGDRVSIVGDYSHLAEFGGDSDNPDWPEYKDISKEMVELMSYEPYLQRGLCGRMVTADLEYQDEYDPAERKPTLAEARGWENQKVNMNPDMIIG